MIDETKIMQYADGTLPQEEHEEVKKAIEADPKLKELYNTFKETGDLLFKLGNEIKSQPIPKNVQEKINILKTWNKSAAKKFGFFNFFGLFKIQYVGIAAAFCFFFGGFYTNTYIASFNNDSKNDVVALTGQVEVPKDLNLGTLLQEQNLEKNVESLYLYFNEEKFLSDVSKVIEQLEVDDVFYSTLKDNDGKVVKLVLAENFVFKGNTCKKVRFTNPLKSTSIDEETNISLDLCKVNEKYEISSIHISK